MTFGGKSTTPGSFVLGGAGMLAKVLEDPEVALEDCGDLDVILSVATERLPV
jgi:hypothetical protein